MLRKMSVQRALGLCLLVAGFLLGQTRPALAAVSNDRRLPENTWAFVTLRDMRTAQERFLKCSTGKVLAEPGMKEFRDEFVRVATEVGKKFDEGTGLEINKLLRLAHGELTLAVVPPKGEGFAVLAFLDVGDNQETLDALRERFDEWVKKNEVKHTEDEVDGATIHFFELKEKSDDLPFEKFGYFIKDKTIVLGSQRDALKEVLGRWDGKGENTLAEKDRYRQILGHCREKEDDREPLAVWYVDFWNTINGVLAAQGLAALPVAGMLQLVPELQRIKGAGGTVDLATNEFDSVFRSLIVYDGPQQGLLNLFQLMETPRTPPKWVREETASYSSMNWGLDKTYAAIEAAVDKFNGKGTFAAALERITGEEGLKLHPKTDFLDHLSGRLVVVTAEGAAPIANKRVAASEVDRSLMAFELKNAPACKVALGKLSRTPGFPFKTREFQGETLFEFETGNDDDEEDEAKSAVFAIAITESHFMITTDVTMLEQVIRGVKGNESLAESKDYRAVLDKMPERPLFINYQNQNAQLRAAVEELRKQEPEELFDGIKFDFRKLPPYETLKKYFTPAGSYVESVEQGISITSFGLKLRDE